MKSSSFSPVILLIFLIWSVNAQQINWLTDYAEAARVAASSGKPMLLDFTASWCAPCKKMDGEFWIRADVAKLSERFVCVKINADKNPDLKKQYGVTGIPNVTLTDSFGNALDFSRGYGKSTPDYIIGKLNSILKNYPETTQTVASVEEITDLSELAKRAYDLQQQKSFLKSNEIFERILKLEENPAQREVVSINVGYNYLQANRLDDALKVFQSFQTDFPKSTQTEMAIYGEFLVLEKKGRLTEARNRIDLLKTQFPKSRLILQAEQLLPSKNAPQTIKSKTAN